MYVVPFSGADAATPADILCAVDIVEFVRKRFPNANMGEHKTYNFNSTDPVWVNKAKEEFDNFNFYSIAGLSKHLQLVNALKEVREETGILTFVNAVTANPPIEEMTLHNFNYNVDQYRNSHNESTISKTKFSNTMYKPWINKHKRDIAKIYKDENLMETLYTLTKSCVNPNSTYKNRECGACWWCYEREWGFK